MTQPTLRFELKYEIGLAQAELLRARLAGLLHPDPHAGPRGYTIRSLYFDDIDYAAYREKVDGVRERSKLRLRYYNFDDSYIVFENKEKLDQLTRKSSVQVSRALAQAMIDGDSAVYEAQTDPLLQRFSALRHSTLLRPRVLVDYRRLPFVYADSNVRITLDLDVKTAPMRTDFFRRDQAMIPVLDEGTAILEVKFDRFLPMHLSRALESVPKTRLAVSKYVKCLSLLE